MDVLSPWILLLLLSAPAVGSFLGVLADRLPRGEGIVRARSTCRGCGATLAVRDLVPVLSFAMSRGRCRRCEAIIPAWFLYLELAAIGMAIWAIILAQDPWQAWLIAIFFWLLITLISTDLTRFCLPDPLTGTLFMVAVALSLTTGNPDVGQALLGAVIGMGAFWSLRIGYQYLRGVQGLGLGDVKLMAGLGAALGPYDLPLMLLAAALGGLIVAAISGRLAARRALPFGAALAAATGLIWVIRHLPS